MDRFELIEDHLYDPVVKMKTDYYSFGMAMPGRNTNLSDYRFGYNGMEMDNEAKGNGNSYTTEFRQYDPRLGRWLSLDPLMGMFPWMSPYVAFDNNPIFYTDPYGLSADGPGDPEKRTGTYNDNRKGIEGNLPTDAKNGDVLTYTFEGGDYEKVEYKRVDSRWEVVKYRKAGDQYSANSQRLQNHPRIPPPEGEPILIAKEVPPTPEITTDESGDGSSTPPDGNDGNDDDHLPPPPCEPSKLNIDLMFKVASWFPDRTTAKSKFVLGIDGINRTIDQNWKNGLTPVNQNNFDAQLRRVVDVWKECNTVIKITQYTPTYYRPTKYWEFGERTMGDLQIARLNVVRRRLIGLGLPETAFQPGWRNIKWDAKGFKTTVIIR